MLLFNANALIEFDKLKIKDSPDEANRITYKWYDRGEKAISIKFDELLVQNEPRSAEFIADKWYDRGEKKIALKFDKLKVQNSPLDAYEIANKWYDRGEKELALEFDILLDFDIEKIGMQENPGIALKKINRLIKIGKFAEAEEFGNKILEYWVSLSDEEIRKDLWTKLALATLLESTYYYEILQSKLIDRDSLDVIENYTKFLENIPLSPGLKDISITDYLTHKTNINPKFLDKFDLSLDSARKMFEIDLYELAKKSDITFSILNIIALHAKQDPYFKLHIFYENPLGDPRVGGFYSKELQRVSIHEFPLGSKMIRGILIHEWTHQAMNILFSHRTNPYAADDVVARRQWNKAMDEIFQKLKEYSELEYQILAEFTDDPFALAISLFYTIQSSYPQFQHTSEAIARFVQMFGMDAYEDPQVKAFLQPIYDYWMQFIEPAIKKYVKDHAKFDTFVSDWERENILDAFYRFELEKDASGKSFFEKLRRLFEPYWQ